MSIKHKKNFFDFFPTPKFLEFAEVGMSISDSSIRFIEFVRRDKSLEIKRFGEIGLPKGVITSGFVNDKEALVLSLSELKNKHGIKYVKSTLPEEKDYVFKTTIPRVKKEEMRDTIQFTIEENVPISADKAVFDFSIIPRTKNNLPEEEEVVVSVMPTKVVETYIEVFNEAGIVPVSFEIESQAIAKAVIPKDDKRSHLIVNINKNKTGLYVVEDEIVQFTSTVNFGNRESHSYSSNTDNKKEENLNKNILDKYPDVYDIKIEIKKIFTYWNTRIDKNGDSERKIEKIIFCGDGIDKKDFFGELCSGINISTEIANVWVNAFSFDKYIPGISFSESLKYGAAIGLALPEKE